MSQGDKVARSCGRITSRSQGDKTASSYGRVTSRLRGGNSKSLKGDAVRFSAESDTVVMYLVTPKF